MNGASSYFDCAGNIVSDGVIANSQLVACAPKAGSFDFKSFESIQYGAK